MLDFCDRESDSVLSKVFENDRGLSTLLWELVSRSLTRNPEHNSPDHPVKYHSITTSKYKNSPKGLARETKGESHVCLFTKHIAART